MKNVQRRRLWAATIVAVVLGAGWASTANATQVFFGNFNGANGGASQANVSGSFAKFVGTPPGFGKVDLWRSGDGGVTCGTGFTSCLSMESSDGHYGQITTIDPALGPGKPAVAVLAGQTVTVSFEASGNQRIFGPSDPDLLNVSIRFFGGLVDPGPVTLGGAWSGVIDPPAPASGVGTGASIAARAPFQLYTMSFVAPQDMGLSVTFKGGPIGNVWTGSDGLGPILDYVAVDVTSPAAVPEPASWAMMLMGFGGLGAALRRRRAALA